MKKIMIIARAALLTPAIITAMQSPLDKQANHKAFVEFDIAFKNPPSNVLNSASSYGIYDGAGYDTFETIVRMQLDPSVAKKALPTSVRTALETLSKKSIDMLDISQCEVQIVGPGQTSDTRGKECNVIFHGFGQATLQKKFFSINLPMGIFDPRAIGRATSSPIAINSLKAEQVVTHASGPDNQDTAYSPNNARFLVEKNNDFASGWTVAYLQEQQTASVTFVLLCTNKNSYDAITTIAQTSNTVRELLNNLAAYALQTSANSKSILQNAVTTIQNLIIEAQPIAEDTALQKALTDLSDALNGLEKVMRL